MNWYLHKVRFRESLELSAPQAWIKESSTKVRNPIAELGLWDEDRKQNMKQGIYWGKKALAMHCSFWYKWMLRTKWPQTSCRGHARQTLWVARYEKAKYELESVKVMRRSFKIMFCKQRQGLQKFHFVMLIWFQMCSAQMTTTITFSSSTDPQASS